MNPAETLVVTLYDIAVGELTYDRKRRKYSFVFSEEYFHVPYDVAPLQHPKNEQKPNLPITNPNRNGAPYFLMNYYNKRRYNSVFEKWCDKYKIEDNSPERFIAWLTFTSDYGPGALEFRLVSDSEAYKELTDKSARIRMAVENLHTIESGKYFLDVLSSLGLFFNGLSRKAAIAIDDDGTIRAERPNDTAVQYIFKRQLSQYGGFFIEITGYEAAREAGIDVPETRLFTFGGETGLLIKRFDRDRGEKIHTVSLESLCPGMKSYEGILSSIIKLGLGEKGIEQMFKRIVFNVFMNITDCHGGNISFILDRDGTWTLAPAYDLVPMLKDGYKHYFSVNGKNKDITIEDLALLGAYYHIRDAETIIEETKQVSEKHLITLTATIK